MVGQVVEDWMALFEFDLIPADVRRAYVIGKFDHAAGQKPEPAM
jgi:hypothetical protein